MSSGSRRPWGVPIPRSSVCEAKASCVRLASASRVRTCACASQARATSTSSCWRAATRCSNTQRSTICCRIASGAAPASSSASPFNSGILATGAVPGATFFYAEASPEIVARTRSLEAICHTHGVPLGAAALQFTLSHPAVVSAVCGYRTPAEVGYESELVDAADPCRALGGAEGEGAHSVARADGQTRARMKAASRRGARIPTPRQ